MHNECIQEFCNTAYEMLVLFISFTQTDGCDECYYHYWKPKIACVTSAKLSFILTYKLSQDHLEPFFSPVRRAGNSILNLRNQGLFLI